MMRAFPCVCLCWEGTVGLTAGVLFCVSGVVPEPFSICTQSIAVLCSIAVVSCALELLRGGRGAFLELNSDSYSSCFT